MTLAAAGLLSCTGTGQSAFDPASVADASGEVTRVEPLSWWTGMQTPLQLLVNGAGIAAYEEFWDPHTLTHPDIPDLWNWLRDNDIRVGVLSNTIWSRERHDGIFERDGVLDLIDGAVYSSETPWVKPAREIFLAVQLEGLSYVAAAERFGVSVTTVKNHLIRAMTRCLLLMEDE